MTVEIIDYETRAAQAEGLADHVSRLEDVVREPTGRHVLCVPGGSTPKPFFQLLSKRWNDKFWKTCVVLPNDERWVPEDHAASNARMMRETLLTGRAASAQFFSLYNGAATPQDAVADVDARLRALFDAHAARSCIDEEDGVFDEHTIGVVVLGMGEDMHTASLFPGAEGLQDALSLDKDAPLVAPITSPHDGTARLTLTVAALLRIAENGGIEIGGEKVNRHPPLIQLLITGPAKRAALERAMTPGPVEKAPIRAFFERCSVVVHYAP